MGDIPKWYEFWGTIRPISRSLGVYVPQEVTSDIGRIGQMRVRLEVNGRETDTLMCQGLADRHYLKLGAGFRAEAGIEPDMDVKIRLAVRDVDPPFETPQDLREALAAEPRALARWEMMPYRLKKGMADKLEAPGRPEIRARRIRKTVDSLVF